VVRGTQRQRDCSRAAMTVNLTALRWKRIH